MSANKPQNSANEQHSGQPDAAEMAERCRRLANSAYDRTTNEMLDRMADDYERQARTDNGRGSKSN